MFQLFQTFKPFNRFVPFKTSHQKSFNSFNSSKEDMPNGELPRFENSRNVEMIDHSNRLEA
jgi:hypothetical protein